MVPGKSNLEREGQRHEHISNNNILQVYDEVGSGGDAEEDPRSHSVDGQAEQEEDGVENRKDHRLQQVVAGAVAGVAVIGGEPGESGVSLHGCCLKHAPKDEPSQEEASEISVMM